MDWIIIAALVVLAFFFLRVKHIRHKVYLVAVILIILFIYITASRVLSEQEIDWKSASDVGKGVKLYFSWLGSVADNFKTIAGKVIKMDWKFNNTSG